MTSEKTEIISLIEKSPFFCGEKGLCIEDNEFINNVSIDKIRFSVRFIHVINERGFKTLKDVLNTDYNNILLNRNCGIKSVSDAQSKIKAFIDWWDKDKNTELEENSNKIESMRFNNSILDNLPPGVKIKFGKISEIPIRNLPIGKRLKKFLSDKPHIKTINDLCVLKLNNLSKTNNLGRKTLQNTIDLLLTTLNMEEREIFFKFSDTKIPILDLIDISLKELSKRELEILTTRFCDDKINSLQYVADKYEVSRERIRQIIQKIIKQVKAKVRTRNGSYRKQFLDIILANPEAITYEQLEDFPLLKRAYNKNIYLSILASMFEEVPFEGFIPKNFELLVKRKKVSNQKWRKIVDTLDDLPLFIGEMTPQKLVNNLSSRGYNISDQLLCFKIILGLKKYFFFKEKSQYFLLKRGGIRETTFTILGSSKNPLDIKEIVDILRKYYYDVSKYENVNAIINIIKQDHRIIQFDRHKFGVEKHFAYSRNNWPQINLLAKKFLYEIKRQSYVTEILEKIKNEFPLLKSKYELVYILRTDPEIQDLQFFNFTLTSFNQEERIKVTEALEKIFDNDPNVKHFSEIGIKLKEQRFIRDEGIGCILRKQDFLKEYLGGFYGLKKLDDQNIFGLSKNEKFINYLISQYFFPNTEIINILNYFGSEELRKNALNVIQTSQMFSIYSPELNTEIIINNTWSNYKTIKCLLYNSNEPVFEEQLLWMLKDLQKVPDKNDLYKIKNNIMINYSDGRYSFIKKDIPSKELVSILDDCYSFINDSAKSFSLDEMFGLVKNYLFDDIEFSEFILAIKEDERFIITDNNMVYIK